MLLTGTSSSAPAAPRNMSGQAVIDEHRRARSPAGEDDVGRLDVAVHQAARVRLLERTQGADGHRDCLARRERRCGQPLLQGRSGDERAREDEQVAVDAQRHRPGAGLVEQLDLQLEGEPRRRRDGRHLEDLENDGPRVAVDSSPGLHTLAARQQLQRAKVAAKPVTAVVCPQGGIRVHAAHSRLFGPELLGLDLQVIRR